MAKELLQKAKEEAIAAALANRTSASSLPIPIPNRARETPAMPSPSPTQIQQVIISSPADNSEFLKEKFEKERTQWLYQQELQKNKQLVEDDAELKIKIKNMLEKSKEDEDLLARILYEKDIINQENTALRQELQRIKMLVEDIKVPEEEIKKEGANIPPSYDSHEETDIVTIHSDNLHYNDVPLAGDIAPPDSPVDTVPLAGATDKCLIS